MNNILLENGDALLQESGDNLRTELPLGYSLSVEKGVFILTGIANSLFKDLRIVLEKGTFIEIPFTECRKKPIQLNLFYEHSE
jgi:hypothetical protein